ncbi:MAG: hypothetical protein AAGE52_09490 [Myxococcota bacterium]
MRTFALALLLGCTSSPTGIFLTVQSDGSLTQLEIEAVGDVFPATLVPEVETVLEPEETVTLLLPRERAGTEVAVMVTGLRDGAPVISAAATVEVVAGQLAELTISLTDDCTPENCNGCCEGDVCQAGNSVTACGSSGDACTRCVDAQSCRGGACTECGPDTCSGCCDGDVCAEVAYPRCGLSADGRCMTCDPTRSDGCNGGLCGCGGGDQCDVGQACVGGLCTCNAESCPMGCCAGNVCVAASVSSCGTGGAMCASCDAASDRCADGACGCGDGPSCGPGETCEGGTCTCGGRTCRSGETCVAGSCLCGGASCGPGQRCIGGMCRCDAMSCRGCCRGNRCRMGNSRMDCGRGGVMCQRCMGPRMCIDGACE